MAAARGLRAVSLSAVDGLRSMTGRAAGRHGRGPSPRAAVVAWNEASGRGRFCGGRFSTNQTAAAPSRFPALLAFPFRSSRCVLVDPRQRRRVRSAIGGESRRISGTSNAKSCPRYHFRLLSDGFESHQLSRRNPRDQ